MNDIPLFKKVLVIDDNEIDRYVAKRVLEKYKFSEEIILKESARKAIDYLQSLESTPHLLPQFIFLDIRMPETDGFGFLEEYQMLHDEIKSSCVIMMLSTSLDKYDHQRANENPYVSKFMNKPLDKDKVEELKTEFK